MPFELVYGDRELVVSLDFESHVEERLSMLLRRGGPDHPLVRTRVELAKRIVEVITTMLEGTALPPTEKQLKYAIAIARELSLELPADVLQFRDAMAAFLNTHAEHYRKRKSYGSGNTREDESSVPPA